MEKQISNKGLLALTQKAFEQNEVADFLQGKSDYACPVSRFTPANVPTDTGRIIEFGIYALYNDTNDETIIQKFKEAILNLLKGDSIQVWVAYSVCWIQIYNEQHEKAPFKLVDDNLIRDIRQAVLKNENELRACREWQGWNKENGLWDDICRMDRVLKANYEVNIL